MESPMDLLDVLQPWLEVLRATTDIITIVDDASKPLEVQVLTTEGRAVDRRTFEAMELLALLSEISYDAWKQALWFQWPANARQWINASAGRALGWTVEIHFNREEDEEDEEDDDTVVDARVDGFLERVIHGRRESTDSPGYAELRKRLEDAYRVKEQDNKSLGTKPVPRARLEIPVWIVLDVSSYSKQLRKLREVVVAQQATLAASSTLSDEYKPLFRIRRMTTGYAEGGFASRRDLELMAKIVESGGYLDRLRVYGIDTDSDVTGVLQAIMGCSSSGGDDRGAVNVVQLSRALDRRAVDALYSALSASRTVSRVLLNSQPYEEEDDTNVDATARRRLWHWIAYTFFSGHATHRISTVHIIVEDITMQDVAAVQEFLEHSDPLVLLRSDGATQDFVPCGSRGSPLVGDLTFHDVTHEAKAPILELLRLIGHGLTKLSFRDVDATNPLDEWLLGVFEACPRLVTLYIHGGLFQSLDTVALSFEKGACHLRELWINQTRVTEAPHAPAFFEKLADLDHPMTKSLSSILVCFQDACGSPHELSKACRLVLKTNFRLHRFDVRVNYRSHSAGENLGWQDIYEQDATPVHARKLPLDLRAKVAFLSVMGNKDGNLEAAVRKLDASVISLVFQFAAQCRTRSVQVSARKKIISIHLLRYYIIFI